MPAQEPWTAIEPGWQVATMDGIPLGTVEQVLADGGDDFHGLTVRVGLGNLPRAVPPELVSGIAGGVVTVEILADEIGQLRGT